MPTPQHHSAGRGYIARFCVNALLFGWVLQAHDLKADAQIHTFNEKKKKKILENIGSLQILPHTSSRP